MSDFQPYGHGFPQPTIKAHACKAPTFGCLKCIEDQRSAWAKATHDAWEKTYQFPKCKGCGRKMRSWGYTVTSAGPLQAEVGCSNIDANEGYCPCAEYDFLVVIG